MHCYIDCVSIINRSFFRGRTKSLPQSKVPPPRPKPPRPPPPRMHSTLANGAEAEEGSESGQNGEITELLLL